MKPLTRGRLWGVLGTLLGVLLVCALLGLLLGSSRIDLVVAFSEWWGGEVRTHHGAILTVARLPHVLLAMLVGAALATVGTVFQGVLRNPLADPYILGVSGGASVGVVLAVAAGLGGTVAGVSTLPLAAFAGALGSIAIIYGVAAVLPGGVRGRHATYTLLLTGVVFNAFAMAVVLFLRSVMSPLDSQRTLFWLMGSLQAGRLSAAETWVVVACVSVGVVILVGQSRKLNLLALGDDTALSLGVSASRVRLWLFVVSSLVVGAAVSAAGMVGFVGLVIPHTLRLLVGADHRLLVPASVLGGAAFLVLADLLSRALAPLTVSVLPVGVVTAFVGVPLFFVFLIRDLRGQKLEAG